MHVMKVRTSFFLLGLLWGAGGVVDCWAAFRNADWGARPAGMGGAFTAVADDSNALLYNPSGITQARQIQGSFMYAKPFAGLDQVSLNKNFFSAVVPSGRGFALGFSWTGLNAPSYRENTASLSFAFDLKERLPALAADVSFGLQADYLSHEFRVDERTRTDRVFRDGNARSAVGLGVSFLAKPRSALLPGLQVGGSGRYLNQPDVGLLDEDKVPRELSLGLGYRWPRFKAALDAVRRDEDTDVRGGVELGLLDPQSHQSQIALRAGANSTGGSLGVSLSRAFQSRFTLSVDYAFLIPIYLEEASGSHVVALSVRF